MSDFIPRAVRTTPILSLLWAALAAPGVLAQLDDEPTKGARPDKETVQRWEIGMLVTASAGECTRMVGTLALPVDWPEQQVTVISEEFSPFVAAHDERMVGAVKQLVVSVPKLPTGEEASAMVTVEIRRRTLLPPADPTIFVKADAKKLPKEIRTYLGPSPRIESGNAKIKALAKDLAKKSADETAWRQVESIYRWVRDNVKPQDVKSQGAAHALKARVAEHEDLTALFIALARASGFPARTVWLPQFCYPEFYLEDEQQQGYWFPCQMLGEAEFGGIADRRPIWQKGDNFRTPERPREVDRYIPPFLAIKGQVEPQVKWIREPVIP